MELKSISGMPQRGNDAIVCVNKKCVGNIPITLSGEKGYAEANGKIEQAAAFSDIRGIVGFWKLKESFLNRPLKLGMIVPCMPEGKTLTKPIGDLYPKNDAGYHLYRLDCSLYELAMREVLFTFPKGEVFYNPEGFTHEFCEGKTVGDFIREYKPLFRKRNGSNS